MGSVKRYFKPLSPYCEAEKRALVNTHPCNPIKVVRRFINLLYPHFCDSLTRLFAGTQTPGAILGVSPALEHSRRIRDLTIRIA
jgi:hypothetical protein